MENKIIEDFVVFVEKLYKETNIHPARIEYIIKNFLGKLDDMEDEFNAIGMLEFAISGHTEGKHFLPWQMFDKSRYCS